MEEKNIRETICEFLKEHNKEDIKLEFSYDTKERRNMEVRISENTIKIFPINISDTYQVGCYKISLEEYYIINICHELGHFIYQEYDYEEFKQWILDGKDNAFMCDNNLIHTVAIMFNKVIKSEINAWKHGQTFVPKGLEENYIKMNRYNIKDRYDFMLKMLEETLNKDRNFARKVIEKLESEVIEILNEVIDNV